MPRDKVKPDPTDLRQIKHGANLILAASFLLKKHGVELKKAYTQPKRGLAVVELKTKSYTVRYTGRADQRLVDVLLAVTESAANGEYG